MQEKKDRYPRYFNPLIDLPLRIQTQANATIKGHFSKKRIVVMEPDETKALSLMQPIRALRKDQIVRRKEKKSEKREENHKIGRGGQEG